MLKNIYSPLSGAIGQEKIIEIISNNLANTNTTGFKEESVSFEAQDPNPWPNYPSALPPAPFKSNMQDLYPLRGNEMEYMSIAKIETDFRQGALQVNNDPLSVAIEGEGFMEVQTPFGARYTRDGALSINADGFLTTKGGDLIQGQLGSLSGLSAEKMKILPSGEVFEGDKFIGQIKTVKFSNQNNLQKIGDNLFIHNGDSSEVEKFTGRILQGSLESSNVNPMKNLTNLILAHRSYEAMQKSLKAHDDALKTVQEKVGQS